MNPFCVEYDNHRIRLPLEWQFLRNREKDARKISHVSLWSEAGGIGNPIFYLSRKYLFINEVLTEVNIFIQLGTYIFTCVRNQVNLFTYFVSGGP